MKFLFLCILNISLSPVVFANSPKNKPNLFHLNIAEALYHYLINIIPTENSHITIDLVKDSLNKSRLVVKESFTEYPSINQYEYTLSRKNDLPIKQNTGNNAITTGNNNIYQGISNSLITDNSVSQSNKGVLNIHIPFKYLIKVTYVHLFNLSITKNNNLFFESASLSIKKNNNVVQRRDEGIIIEKKAADEKIFIEGFFPAVEVTDFKIPLRICNFYLAPKYWISSDYNSGNVTLDFSNDSQVFSPNLTPLEAYAFFLTTTNLTKVRTELFPESTDKSEKSLINIPNATMTLLLLKDEKNHFEFYYDKFKYIIFRNNKKEEELHFSKVIAKNVITEYLNEEPTNNEEPTVF